MTGSRGLAGLSVVALMALPTFAHAQVQGPSASTSGGGASSGGGIRHFGAVGLGMGVGQNAGGGIRAFHGFLAGAAAARDNIAPTFDPPPGDIVAPTLAAQCVGRVVIPAVNVVDNRDRNPDVTMTLLDPPMGVGADLDPEGDTVDLPVGTFDVLVEATDNRGNQAQVSFQISVVDQTPPTVQPVPDPTPIGGEAEATSPAGTPVALGNFGCVDACDPNATGTSNARASYPVGDTAVTLRCTDSSGNFAEQGVTVRVRDTTPPRLAGAPPDAFGVECNDPNQTTVRVPAVPFLDNGSSANAMTYSLIINPDSDNINRSPVPENITLPPGQHVLRYVARDEAGNQGTVDLAVEVLDRGAPRLEVLNAPDTGWYNNDANVQIRVVDDCGAVGGNLQLDVQPAPQQQAINDDVITLTYTDDGLYTLSITVTDAAGNDATNNAVAFGIDRTRPVASVAQPPQVNVDPIEPLSYTLYPMNNSLALSFGGEDQGDGVVSGIRSISVVLDPGSNDERVLVDFEDSSPVGNPSRGDRAVRNVGCQDVPALDPFNALCDEDGELVLRDLPVGPHVLRTTVTDFAGNTTVEDAYFMNANLHAGLEVVVAQMTQRLADLPNNPLPQNTLNNLVAALGELQDARNVTAVTVAGSPYETPTFLGTGLVGVQSATAPLTLAVGPGLNPGDATLITRWNSILQRIALSDLELYSEYIESLGLLAVLNDQFLRDEYLNDMDREEQSRATMQDAIAQEAFSQSAQSALDAFFSLKMAHTSWLMNWNAVPQGGAGDLAQYDNALAIVTEITQELGLYLQIPGAPASQAIRQIQAQMNELRIGLAALVNNGFDTPNGLSDYDYLVLLLDARSTVLQSQQAVQNGAFMLNYQWAVITILRWMVHASTARARTILGPNVADNLDVFTASLQRINRGVANLDAREPTQAMNLYTQGDSSCLMVQMYHCYYVADEGDDDQDPHLGPVDLPLLDDNGCDQLMVYPDDWQEDVNNLQPGLDERCNAP